MSGNPEKDFDSIYCHVREKLFSTNRYYQAFFLSALFVYLAFTGKYKVDTSFNLKLFIKNSLLYVVSKVFYCIFFLSGRNKFNVIVALSEPSHVKQFESFELKLRETCSVLIVTDKFSLFFKYRLQGTPILFIPDGNNRIIGKLEFTEFKEDIQGHFAHLSQIKLHHIKEIAKRSIHKISEVQRIFKKLTALNKIESVLVFNDITPFGRILTYSANAVNIPTFYCMHGILSDEYIESMHICQHFYVYGEATKTILTKRGLDQEKIIVTGAPYLDTLTNVKELKHESSLKSKLNIPENRKVVLVTLSGPGHTTSLENHLMIVDAIQKILSSQQTKYYFIFKLHKKDTISNYDLIQQFVGQQAIIIDYYQFNEKDSIFEWLALADILLTGASTTALEAMLFSVPVVTIDFKNEYSTETLFIRERATYHVDKNDQLLVELDRALNHGDEEIMRKANSFIAYNFYKLDGQSSGRLVNELNKQVKKAYDISKG